MCAKNVHCIQYMLCTSQCFKLSLQIIQFTHTHTNTHTHTQTHKQTHSQATNILPPVHQSIMNSIHLQNIQFYMQGEHNNIIIIICNKHSQCIVDNVYKIDELVVVGSASSGINASVTYFNCMYCIRSLLTDSN